MSVQQGNVVSPTDCTSDILNCNYPHEQIHLLALHAPVFFCFFWVFESLIFDNYVMMKKL